LARIFARFVAVSVGVFFLQQIPVESPAAEEALEWGYLQAAELPPYNTSLFRYLYQPSAGQGGKFISVTAGAPENKNTRPLAEALAGGNHHVSLNPQGGRLMAMAFAPISYEDYADLLGGKSWQGVEHGKKQIRFAGPYRSLNEWTQAQQDGAHLFLGTQGRAGRFLETFHLKLHLFTEALRQVRSFIQERQLPFLNLSAESFRVSLADVGSMGRHGVFDCCRWWVQHRTGIRRGSFRPFVPHGGRGHAVSRNTRPGVASRAN